METGTREPRKAAIVVVGSANLDMTIRVPHLPRPGETLLGGTFSSSGGGKGANQAVAAARSGGRVGFVARLGLDAAGDTLAAQWEADGIPGDHLVRDGETPSGVALIFVDGAGENCIAVAPGANDRLEPADIDRARDLVQGASVLLLQLEIPLATVAHAAGLARAAGVRVILNPAPARSLDPELLRRVSILTPNATEAECLTGIRVEDEASARLAAARLLEQGPEVVIITLGARGALLATAGQVRLIPAFPVKAVDTVAAGDVFNGALAVALAEGRDLPEAARFAGAAAALSVTRAGAQASAPRRAEIDSFLSLHF